jgi:hypothetical protein
LQLLQLLKQSDEDTEAGRFIDTFRKGNHDSGVNFLGIGEKVICLQVVHCLVDNPE